MGGAVLVELNHSDVPPFRRVRVCHSKSRPSVGNCTTTLGAKMCGVQFRHLLRVIPLRLPVAFKVDVPPDARRTPHPVGFCLEQRPDAPSNRIIFEDASGLTPFTFAQRGHADSVEPAQRARHSFCCDRRVRLILGGSSRNVRCPRSGRRTTSERTLVKSTDAWACKIDRSPSL